MNGFSKLNRCLLSTLVTITALAGCVNWRSLSENRLDGDFTREQRKQRIVESFESRRDGAQFQAAVARWEQGDTQGCENLLLQLLERTPSNVTARLWLADLYAEQQNFSGAERQLRIVLHHNPNAAQAHHSLGLLLDSAGRADEAINHLETAQQLDPYEPLYARSCQAIRAAQVRH